MALAPFFASDPLFHQFDTAFDRAFDRALGRGLTSGTPSMAVSTPSIWRSVGGTHPMDVIETTTAYELHADAPGMTPEDIKVELNNNTLVISGEHKEEKKQERDGKVWRQERSFRKFTRSFALPDNTKPDEISASLENGVLTVTVPKAPEPKKPEPKRITVSAGAGAAAAPSKA